MPANHNPWWKGSVDTAAPPLQVHSKLLCPGTATSGLDAVANCKQIWLRDCKQSSSKSLTVTAAISLRLVTPSISAAWAIWHPNFRLSGETILHVSVSEHPIRTRALQQTLQLSDSRVFACQCRSESIGSDAIFIDAYSELNQMHCDEKATPHSFPSRPTTASCAFEAPCVLQFDCRRRPSALLASVCTSWLSRGFPSNQPESKRCQTASDSLVARALPRIMSSRRSFQQLHPCL